MVFNPEFSYYKDIIPTDWAVVDTSPNVTFISTICKVELHQQVLHSGYAYIHSHETRKNWTAFRILNLHR